MKNYKKEGSSGLTSQSPASISTGSVSKECENQINCFQGEDLYSIINIDLIEWKLITLKFIALYSYIQFYCMSRLKRKKTIHFRWPVIIHFAQSLEYWYNKKNF